MRKIVLILCILVLISYQTSCQKIISPVQPMIEFSAWNVGDRFQPAYNATPPDTMIWKGKQQDLTIHYDCMILYSLCLVQIQTASFHVSQNFSYTLQMGYGYVPFFELQQKGLYFKLQADQQLIALRICLFTADDSIKLQGAESFIKSSLGPLLILEDEKGKSQNLKFLFKQTEKKLKQPEIFQSLQLQVKKGIAYIKNSNMIKTQ